MGNGYSVAWRQFDAQFWGVPQRRKRIYLVADFAGGSAGKILFESEGLSGYSAEGFRSWQRAAGSFTPCAGATGFDGYNGSLTEDISATLGVNCGMSTGRNGVVLNDQGGNRMDVTDLTKQNAGGSQRMPGKDNFNCVLQPFGICSKDSNAMKSSNPHSGIYEAETSRTLDCNGGNPGCNQGGIAVVESYAIQGSMIGRDDKNDPQGDGINEDVSFTLNTVDRHAVYAMTTGSFAQVSEDKAPTVLACDYKDPTAVCYGIGRDTFNQGQNAKFTPTFEKELQPTLVAKGPSAIQSGYTVRRLTPTECARLQGFPDNWCADLGTEKPTDEEMYFWHKVFKTYSEVTGCKMKSDKQIKKWLADPYSDSAEYKMWGNGVALPCVWFVLCGIVWAMPAHPEIREV